MLTVVALGTATALATGLGAIPVFLLRPRTMGWEPALWGVTAGVMSVASIVGLLRPAIHRGSAAAVAGGLVAGVAFLVLTHVLLRRRDVHVGRLRGADVRTAVLVFAVLFAHSLPEGLAVGTAYASGTAALGTFVILAIALQNIPEGTSVAIPMAEAGFSRTQQFWAAVLTSSPQPVGAAIAYALVETVESLLRRLVRVRGRRHAGARGLGTPAAHALAARLERPAGIGRGQPRDARAERSARRQLTPGLSTFGAPGGRSPSAPRAIPGAAPPRRPGTGVAAPGPRAASA